MYVIYLLYLAFLYGWTYISLYESNSEFVKPYMIACILLVILGSCVCIGWEDKKRVRKGVVISLSLLALGASVAFNSGEKAMVGYIKDLVMMTIGFVAVYIMVKGTTLYKIKIINLLIGVVLPFSLVYARLFGTRINGSYMYFGRFLIFGFVLMGYPFLVAYFMSLPETYYWKGSVKNLSLNVLAFLLYTLLLFAGCTACNEFGLLLVLAITATGVFFVKCRNILTKLIYSLFCLVGAVTACRFIPHVKDRTIIWLDPSAAAVSERLAEKAETVLYLFRNFPRMGWYGNGISNLPKSIYTTFNSDHVLVTLINDYSIIIAFLVLGMSFLLIWWMFEVIPGLDTYDRYLLLSGGLIIASIIAIHVGSNLGSFITAGIGLPFVSDGGTVNLMLATIVATRCGIMERVVNENVAD